MDKLTQGFEKLEKKGYFAERNLACCRTCAMHEIPEENDCLYVFTTAQDEADLENDGECYISWSAPEDDSKEIIRELKKAGLIVVHDKKPTTRIKIKIN